MKRYLIYLGSIIISLFVFSIFLQFAGANTYTEYPAALINKDKTELSVRSIDAENVVRKSFIKDSANLPTYYMEPSIVPAWWHLEDTVNFRFVGESIPSEFLYISGRITDVSGNEIARVKRKIDELKLNGWSWKPTTPGYYQVTFSFVNKNGTEKVLNRPVTIRAKDRISHVFLREEQGFGVLPASKPFEKVIGQFGFTYSNNPVEADLAKLIGFDLVRLLCDWGASFTNLHKGIESVKGHYNWQIFDRKVDVFANSGFVLNTQFCYTPLWASPFPEKTNINICTVEGTTYAPKDMNDFSRFVEAAVARYKDRISLWEIWNEPSVPGGSVFWSDTPENFVRLLKAGYKAVKKVQPKSQVWLGGLGPRPPYHVFYNKILQLGAADYFDVLSLHGAWNTPAEKFNSIDDSNHIAHKPAVSGEWHAILQGNMQSEPILSEPALSFKMMKDLLYQIKQGISRTMLFEMINLSEKETLPFAIKNKIFTHSSGLFRKSPQLEPRHAAIVMANFLQATGRQATYVKDFMLDNDAVSLELSTGKGPIIAFWSDSVALKIGALKPFTTSNSVLCDWEGKIIPLNSTKLLEANKLYYLSNVNTSAIKKAEATNHLISPRSIIVAPQKVAKGMYHNGVLFHSTQSPSTITPQLWLQNNWKTTLSDKAKSGSKFSARAAVGIHEKGVDIVVEVLDSIHFQNQQSSEWLNGDNIHIAIDCEGKGAEGGNTEIVVALTKQGPMDWKILAADPHGDIPSQWSSANSKAKYVDQTITRKNNVTRYQLRIPWSELYPLVYDTTKPLRLSILVNKYNNSGRIGYLEWGGGVIGNKDPKKYGALYLNRSKK